MTAQVTPLTETKTDYALLIARMKKIIFKGQINETHYQTLANKNIWANLTPEQALEWARLIQITGKTDLALEALNWINEHYPDFMAAWQEHFHYLIMLEKRDSAIELRAKALLKHPELADKLPLSIAQSAENTEQENGIEAPFEEEKNKTALLKLYFSLFQGRENCFARQWADKKEKKQGYVPVRRPMTIEDIQEHLKGFKTYGIYLLRSDNTVKLAVIDVDITPEFRQKQKLTAQDKDILRRERNYLLTRIPELSQKAGFKPLIEFSGGKGYHFWYFFREPVPASTARRLLNPIVLQLNKDISVFHLELFPKQDKLQGKGFGNLVKLPLGIHRVSGRQSYFLDQPNKDVWQQLEVLKKVQPVSLQEIENKLPPSGEQNIIIHPKHKEWADKYPELALLSERCAALGQIIATCRQSKEISLRAEKILFGTIGFLKRRKTLLHYLFQHLPEYNPHLVDYKLSRLRGTPLGCKKIHTLLAMNIDYCDFEQNYSYAHPLLHCPQYTPEDNMVRSEKIDNLTQALEQLKVSIEIVKRFLPA